MKEYILEKLIDVINDVTYELMVKENINTGDISPEQTWILDESIENIAKIIIEVIEENR